PWLVTITRPRRFLLSAQIHLSRSAALSGAKSRAARTRSESARRKGLSIAPARPNGAGSKDKLPEAAQFPSRELGDKASACAYRLRRAGHQSPQFACRRITGRMQPRTKAH